MEEQLASLGSSPELFPFELDPLEDTVCFLRLTRADYAAASFLDSRILSPQSRRQWVPWAEVRRAVETERLRESCAYIFHIGHCGSTLLSRLVGEHPGSFALREPLVLRTFAHLAAAPAAGPAGWTAPAHLAGCLKLLSRTFETRQRAVLKATSFVSELAADLLARQAAPRAVLLLLSPESFLATILGGPNSRQEAARLAAGRLRRLHARIGGEAWRLDSLSEGEMIALGWACETSALASASNIAPGRALPLDFDRFLADPSPLLRQVLRHLGIEATADEVRAITAGPHMQRYSKAPEHGYDAALRLQVLNAARAAQAGEIRRGLAWLERAARDFPPVRAAMDLAQVAAAVPGCS